MWHAAEGASWGIDDVEGVDNAKEIYTILASVGWSFKAVCAFLGNGAGESGLNPWRWESDYLGSQYVPTYSQFVNDEVFDNSHFASGSAHGYGLVGFTPSNTYINENNEALYSANGYAPHYRDAGHQGSPLDGAAQMMFLTKYIPDCWGTGDYGYYAEAFSNYGVNINNFYNIPFKTFMAGNASLENLTGAFELEFERPADWAASSSYSHRVQQAKNWYEKLKNFVPSATTSNFTFGSAKIQIASDSSGYMTKTIGGKTDYIYSIYQPDVFFKRNINVMGTEPNGKTNYSIVINFRDTNESEKDTIVYTVGNEKKRSAWKIECDLKAETKKSTKGN